MRPDRAKVPLGSRAIKVEPGIWYVNHASGSQFRAVAQKWSDNGTTQVVFETISSHTPPRLSRYTVSPARWRAMARNARRQADDWLPTEHRGVDLSHLKLVVWEGGVDPSAKGI